MSQRKYTEAEKRAARDRVAKRILDSARQAGDSKKTFEEAQRRATKSIERLDRKEP